MVVAPRVVVLLAVLPLVEALVPPVEAPPAVVPQAEGQELLHRV